MKKVCYALLLMALLVRDQHCIGYSGKIWITTNPKSGTHLIKQLICKLTGYKHFFYNNLLTADNVTREQLLSLDFLMSHTIYTPEIESLIVAHNYKIITILRDPRDHIISYVYWILKYPKEFPDRAGLNFDQLITVLITNIEQSYRPYLRWKNSTYCYTTTFEKLVGPRGGGYVHNQLEEIKNIAKHIGITLTIEQVMELADTIYGNTPTFREGKIGSWKRHFKKEHKQLFKQVASNLLIELGYEKNNLW